MRPKKNTKDFAQQVIAINPKITVLGQYVNSSTKIQCQCKICGQIWSSLPSNLLHGHGCPACNGTPQKSTEAFKRELKGISPQIDIIGTYKSSHDKILCRCSICNTEWYALPTNLLKGHGCPICNSKPRKTTALFVEEMKSINPTIRIIGQYHNDKTKIRCNCLKCGNSWYGYPTNLLRKQGCPSCGRMKITNESFLKKVSEINDRIEFLDEYKGYRKKIKCRCKDCGYVWMSTPASLYKSQKCPSCFGTHNNRERNLLMRNSFVKKVQEINPSITIIGEYTRLTDTIKCKCNNCGNEWTPYANNLLKGYGCPKCSKSGTSFMEQLLLLVLINAFNGKCEVVSRDRSVIGMELDILIPTLKVAIEPGSWSMHKKALKRDTEKRRLCNEHGIRIITIYDSYTEEKPPFETDCLVFPYDLGSEKNHSTLRNIIVPFLFHLLGLNAEFDDPSWRGFEQEAKKRSLALSTESFKERIKAISPTITILGDYVSEKTPIKCKCEICGYVWDAFPSNLFKGRGCFKCNGNPPKNTSLFQKELSVINPKIIVLGEYKSSKQRIRCKCAECGYEWEAFPGNLLRGHGCTNCFNMRRRNSSNRKSHESFVSQIESINPNIEIVGSYVNDSTRIECRCRICGNQWMPYATNLLRGHGCPICARTWRKTLGN